MGDFGNYMKAQAEKRAAYERYNYAVAALENAQIKERLAEIKSQQEPLAGLLSQPLSERDRLYASAFYVVVGHMPNAKIVGGTPSDESDGSDKKEGE
jgi:hypothetical protein